MSAIIIVLILLAFSLGSYGLLVYVLAQSKTFFTAPKEGSGEFVMTGNAVNRLIVVWEGRGVRKTHAQTIDDYDIVNAIDADEQQVSLLHYLNPVNWMEPFGIYWVGIWPWYKIYRYDFIWTEEQRDEQGRIVPHTRKATRSEGAEGQTSFIYLKDVNYFFVVDDVKTKGGVPLRFTILVTVSIKNPYKALFEGANWIERMGSAISDVTVLYAGALEYEAIMASEPATLERHLSNGKEIKGTFSLEQLIKMAGDRDVDDITDSALLEHYGTEIISAKRHQIDFANESASTAYKEATTARYTAEQEGKAQAIQAKGQAEAIETLAKAEKQRIDTVYGAVAGDDQDKRMEIRRLEAMEKSGAAGGNTIVVPDEVLGLAKRLGSSK